MLLAIEQGNSNTVFAVCDGAEVLAQWRAATATATTAEYYAGGLGQFFRVNALDPQKIDNCVISSVAPAALGALRRLSQEGFGLEPLIVGENLDPGVEVRLPNPWAVGVDRLVNAVGGFPLYGGPLLIVDAGTATKFDVVAADGAFEGGVIAPGFWPSAATLARSCAHLTDIAVERPETVTGRTTTEAMRSGLFFGFLALVEGLIDRVKAEYGAPVTVIATGGVAALLADDTDRFDYFDSDLTVRGLIELHRRRA